MGHDSLSAMGGIIIHLSSHCIEMNSHCEQSHQKPPNTRPKIHNQPSTFEWLCPGELRQIPLAPPSDRLRCVQAVGHSRMARGTIRSQDHAAVGLRRRRTGRKLHTQGHPIWAPPGFPDPRGALSLFMLEPGVVGQAGFPGAQLDITLMKILAARLGTTAPIIEWLANLLAPFQHRDSRPFVRLDHAPLLGRAFVLRLIALRQAALWGGTCLRQGWLDSRGAPVNMGLA